MQAACSKCLVLDKHEFREVSPETNQELLIDIQFSFEEGKR